MGDHVTPRYVCKAAGAMILAAVVGGVCGTLVAMVVAALYMMFGTGTLPGAIMADIIGTGSAMGVLMFVGDVMAEVAKLREYQKRVQG